MNELMVLCAGNQWMYFRTLCTTVKSAYGDFQRSMQDAKVNIDNLQILSAELRDLDGNAIEGMDVDMEVDYR